MTNKYGKMTETQIEVYRAENHIMNVLDQASKMDNWQYTAFRSTFTLPRELKFGNLQNVQDYVDNLLDKPEIILMKPDPVRVIVIESRYEGIASMYSNKMALPDSPDFLRQLRVLHELAHYLSGSTAHASKFREAYIRLVDHEMGPELALILRMYIDLGV